MNRKLTSVGKEGVWREWFNWIGRIVSPCTLSSTNLLTSEKRNQLKSEWCLIDWECWRIDWHEIKPDKCFKIIIFFLITIWLFGFSGVSFHSTELALNSSENVRSNYLSNDDIYDHMNLQLTTVYSWTPRILYTPGHPVYFILVKSRYQKA